MFTSSHACTRVGTKPKTRLSALQRRLGVVSCVFGEGAEREVKAAWPIWARSTAGVAHPKWHPPLCTLPDFSCPRQRAELPLEAFALIFAAYPGLSRSCR